MPPTIANAIPTTYNGTTFCSQLEARWAVFFDNMGIAWEYESRAVDLDGQRVVQDFWLPQYDCGWEVKASQDFDRDRFGAWAAIANMPVVISNRLPHYCASLTPAWLVVIEFPCAEPVSWSEVEPGMSNVPLRQRIAESTGRTWVYSESRIPGQCPDCARHVLLTFDEDANRVTCLACQWSGYPASLMARYGVAGDAAEAFTF